MLTSHGRLAEAKEAGHISGKSELKLELTDIMINQQLQPIVTGDYEVSGKSRGANTAKKVGTGKWSSSGGRSGNKSRSSSGSRATWVIRRNNHWANRVTNHKMIGDVNLAQEIPDKHSIEHLV